MLVATRSFVTSDPYCGEVRIVKGVSQIAEGHSIVKRHRSAFRPAPGRPEGAREAEYVTMPKITPPPPVSRNRGREPWRILGGSGRCSVSRRQSSVAVRLSQSARHAIVDAVDRTTARDALEVGGVLFGSADQSLIEIVRASAAGPNADRQRASYSPDREHDRTEIARAMADGLRVCGGWHSHPGGAGVPSRSDLSYFSGFRDLARLSSYLEIICFRSGHGWDLAGWLTTPTVPTASDRCQPVRL
jgi:integrative and conjugative element protein (TIGR02256 family)